MKLKLLAAIAVILAITILTTLFLYLYLLFSPAEQNIVRDSLNIYKPQVIGFQPYWLVGKGQESYAKDITTLTYFGLSILPDGTIKKYDRPGEYEPGWAMLNNENYKKNLADHKAAGVRLSLLVANMNEEEIMALINDPINTSRILIDEVEPLMKEHGFTDLNLDIESFKLASDSARIKYAEFVKNVKNLIDSKKLGTLTVELTPKSPVEKHLIDVERIGQIADFVVLMAYDYHYSLSETAGPVAPVNGGPDRWEYDVTTALEQTLRLIPGEKILLGIPFYGYEWETLSGFPGAPTISRSWSVVSNKRALEFVAGCSSCSAVLDQDFAPYTVYPGEFIDLPLNPLASVSSQIVLAEEETAYYNHMHQLTYEDPQSLGLKLDLARKNKIAGVAFWALGYENPIMFEPVKKYRGNILFDSFKRNDTAPEYFLAPSGDSLTGRVATMSGTVKKLKRGAAEFTDVTYDDEYYQGETFFSDIKSRAEIVIKDYARLETEEMTEIDLPEMVPPNIIVKQKSGTARYTLLGNQPFSVRVHHLLATLMTGSFEVAIDGDLAVIRQKSGKSVVGYIDEGNTTYVREILSGQEGFLDYSVRSLDIR